MKPTYINHPLREIRFEYQKDEPLSEFESAAVQEYILMHNVLHDLITRKDAMAGEVLRFELQLNDCEEDLVLLEKEILQCGPLAGYTQAELEEKGVTLGKVDITAVLKKAQEHQLKMDKWFDASAPLHADYKKWNAEVDAFDERIDKFKEIYYDEIIHNYEDKDIYSPALDEDMQGFYHFWDSITYHPPFLKNYGAYVKRHNEYLAKVKAAFDRISKLSEVSDEVVKTKSNSGFGMN